MFIKWSKLFFLSFLISLITKFIKFFPSFFSLQHGSTEAWHYIRLWLCAVKSIHTSRKLIFFAAFPRSFSHTNDELPAATCKRQSIHLVVVVVAALDRSANLQEKLSKHNVNNRGRAAHRAWVCVDVEHIFRCCCCSEWDVRARFHRLVNNSPNSESAMCALDETLKCQNCASLLPLPWLDQVDCWCLTLVISFFFRRGLAKSLAENYSTIEVCSKQSDIRSGLLRLDASHILLIFVLRAMRRRSETVKKFFFMIFMILMTLFFDSLNFIKFHLTTTRLTHRIFMVEGAHMNFRIFLF